jgi:AcrR family transcriptional regulator
VPRTALTAEQIGEFRDELCAAAARLFAAHGYDGVTLRGLADELGCSPMTPYRYFRDKAEIFTAVRTAAFVRFAQAQERAFRSTDVPLARLRAMGEAYVHFAEREPDAYRIMFEMSRAGDDSAEQRAAERRGFEPLRRGVELAIAAGVLRGSTDTLALLLWSGLHGVVSLSLAGSLDRPQELRRLCGAMMDVLTEGARTPPPAKRASRGKRNVATARKEKP